MRELRTYELDGAGIPVSWRVRHGERVTALAGRLWLTLEGGSADIWLRPGESFDPPEGDRVWLSAERGGARFELAYTPAALSWRRLLFAALLLARRLRAPRTAAFGDCPQSGR
ncbi:hypothetical protein BKK79_09075 [Cupriavidus sp. USMAA2-4]|uniref:DUF2917 domain-containing protein n=1 Tax=Cupriavidus malaysiensis TaxID=367825 RepID=A0ABN4TJH9_9BURK|nr:MULTISPECIES: DUF2917 domain-containing protein [Cupriavidus]AOY91930.1 hypothetical protein BKK79_09075 [Cupriavidus sp. USMAA2-4]AOY98511.1 hypothetical protein BKK81_03845 [Cupriavidus sp. USMAHM13]AOZ04941.1 hypothetical protein BKK80_03190 [Cupriavidus malaysiensis]